MKLEVETAWKYVDSALSVPASRENWKTYQRIGRLCEQHGQWQRALRTYDALARVYPTWEQNLQSRAVVLLQLDRPDDAVAALNAAIQAKPGAESSHAALGLLHYARGELELADRELAKVQTHASRLLATAVQALIARRLGRPFDAVRARLNAMAGQGPEPLAFATLGRYLLGDIERKECQRILTGLNKKQQLRSGISAQLRFVDAMDKLARDAKSGVSLMTRAGQDLGSDSFIKAIATWMAKKAARAGDDTGGGAPGG